MMVEIEIFRKSKKIIVRTIYGSTMYDTGLTAFQDNEEVYHKSCMINSSEGFVILEGEEAPSNIDINSERIKKIVPKQLTTITIKDE